MLPVEPSIVISSPACRTVSPIVTDPASMWISDAPTTAGTPHPRATTAAWLTSPPRWVRMPRDACMPSTSSGDVSGLTRMTDWPLSAASSAASADSTMRPLAAPGDTGNPLPIGSTSSTALRLAWKKTARSSGLIEVSVAAIADGLGSASAERTADRIVSLRLSPTLRSYRYARGPLKSQRSAPPSTAGACSRETHRWTRWQQSSRPWPDGRW